MSNVLGSVYQRLKGRMSLQLALTFLLVSLVLPDTTSALFYTNSKEHDYPRIGRRSGTDSDVDVLTESGELGQYPNHPRDEATFKHHSRLIADAVFRSWDTNGDGFLSRNEFWPLIRRNARSP